MGFSSVVFTNSFLAAITLISLVILLVLYRMQKK